MKNREQFIFTLLLFMAVLTDLLRGYCESLVTYDIVTSMDYNNLYYLLDSVGYLFYTMALAYVCYIFSHKNIIAFLTHSLMSGLWLFMALIDVWQEIRHTNTKYEAGEVATMCFGFALAIITGCYRWNKRRAKKIKETS